MTGYVASCDCGYRKTSRTPGLAQHGLRMHSCEHHAAKAERRRRGEARRAEWQAMRAVRKPCPHDGRHRHGTHATYVLDRCRCTDCATANSAYERRRVRQNAYGRPPYANATPVREHVRALMAQGMGHQRIARKAGVPVQTVQKLLYGASDRPLGPSKRMRPENAERLLAVTLDLADHQSVDAAPTRELVQAIIARGYPLAWICRRIGITNQRLLHRQKMRVSTAAAVAALADECALHPGPSLRAIRMAEAHGWTADALWPSHGNVERLRSHDDVDPVVVDRVLDGETVERLTIAERYEAYTGLVRRGTPRNEAARRLGLSGRTQKVYAERLRAVGGAA